MTSASTITLSTIQLKRLLTDAATAGATAALEGMAPTENMLTKNEVMRWLKRIGKPTTYLKKMEDEGLIHGKRNGSSSNSMILYRKSDVQTAMQSLNLFNFINN